SPEDAFVGAANMCYQIVFLGIAKSLGVEVLHFKCKAVGRLETVDGVRRFTGIALSPEIQVAPGTDMSKIAKVMEAAKRKCPVTNSMNLDISVETPASI
ncbi:MAG: OsmC family protein, partial [Thermoplasmata archaeon]